MKKFILTERNGMLVIDRILFESYYPILFTCKNEFNDTFVCLCCQHNQKGIRWLIGKTDNSYMIQLLKDQITIRKLLEKNTSDKICVDYINEQYSINYLDDWKDYEDYLPKEDSYMYAEPGEFDEDIAYFLESEFVSYSMDEYKKVIDNIIPCESGFVIDECILQSSVFFNSDVNYDQIILSKNNIIFTDVSGINLNDISYGNSKSHNIVDKTTFISNASFGNNILNSNVLAEAA